MRLLIFILIAFSTLTGCAQKPDSTIAKPIQWVPNGNDSIAVYKWNEFKKLLHMVDNDTTYVINFWATWCKPCVEELPEFEKINQEFAGEKVKVILVSLDMKTAWNSALTGFINNKGIKSEVVVLYEVDANMWINQVYGAWSGAIPATMIYHGHKQRFHEGKMTSELIRSLIEEVNE